MAKRNSGKTNNRKTNNNSSTGDEKTQTSSSTADSVEHRVVAFAEQVGRIVGTARAKSEGWFDRDALREQFASVRDKASEMVEYLSHRQETTSARAPSPRGRSGGIVDAPGKKHRKPLPTTPGTKHSDTRIAKMKYANETRRRGPTRQQ